ncbi:MAG TPA: hypothetical protein VF525_20005 [Pyrinomonadaceae bacterium]
MKYLFRLSGLCFALVCLTCVWAAAQTPTPTPTATPTPDPFVVPITAATPPPVPSPSPSATPVGSFDINSFVGDINGNGRFVVFESRGDLATLAPGQTARTPGNADGNREIFLWDAAQRRIFQITNTKSALVDPTKASIDAANIAVEVSNNRPQISRDGRFIVFSSNAPTPGNFDGTTADNKAALQADGNQEIFLYQIPDVAAVDLTSGTDPGYIELSNPNNFTRVTNTPASALPRAGGANSGPFVADDNRYATINDTGTRIAFVSTRDLTPCNQATNPTRCNSDANPEIFAWRRGAGGGFTQITVTSGQFIFNDTPSISGGTSDDVVGESPNSTIAFYSNAKTLPDASGANAAADNADGNGEVFAATYNGATVTALREVTRTKTTSFALTVNLLTFGRRVSRNGNLIAFESLADDPNANNNTLKTGEAVFIYNLAANTFVSVVARPSDTESDLLRQPTFTGDSTQLVFASTLNLKPDGTRVDINDNTGLNPFRDVNLFVVNVPAAASTPLAVVRLTNIQGQTSLQFALSNTIERVAFSIATELGSGAGAAAVQAYYNILPPAAGATDTAATASALAFFTGASRRPVATATASPTPTPSPTPATTPLPGLSPGMIAIVDTTAQSGSVTFAPSPATVGCTPAGANCDAASESHRRPPLPFELNGVSLSIANAAAGLYFVSPNEIVFEVPRGLGPTTGTNTVPVVINIRTATGVRTVRSLLQIVATQPDIFTSANGPDGRAVVSNVTNPLLATGSPEPFTVMTTYTNGAGQSVTERTKLRLLLTGVRGQTASQITVRLVKLSDNSVTDISGNDVLALAATDMPGVFQLDFLLPTSLAGAGDVAVIVIASGNQSRPADTAPRFSIAPNP